MVRPQSASGNQVDRFIGGVAAPTTEPRTYCDPNPSGFEWRSVAGQPNPAGIPHYDNGMVNRISAWGTPTGGDPTQSYSLGPYIEAMEITLEYEPPPVIEFDITNTTSADDRMILISRTRTETQYDYPSQYQRRLPGTGNADRDGKIEITGTVKSASGQALANRTIYLRVADPPDPSPYAVNPTRGDNRVWPSGSLDDVSVTTDGSGRFKAVFTGSAVAGDNYRIQASTYPSFNFTLDCNAANNCYESGELTMWKRVYVEKRRMVRNGLFLAEDAPAGANFIVVRGNRYLGNRHNDRLSRNDRIVLLHAPHLSRTNASDGWYMEPHTILAVQDLDNGTYRVELGTRQGNNVARETLQRAYSVDERETRIGDALTRITAPAITAADVFDASDDLVLGAPGRTSVFRESFLEYIYLPSTAYGADVPMPYLRNTETEQALFQALADKWSTLVGSARRTPPNHQLLVIAATGDRGGNEPNQIAGLRITEVDGEASSWVFRERIEDIANNASAAERWAMKTCAHELAHQWLPNLAAWPDSGDHCPADTRAFDAQAIYCLLAAATPEGSESQRTNGIARFHRVPHPANAASWHSEYFEIRDHADPFVP